MSRVIGFDHGSRRIGVAVADTEIGQAFARTALTARQHDRVAAAIGLARSEGAETAVVGLPRNMDGSEGPQARAARAFGTQLAEAGLRVVYVDERLTTWDARTRLAGRRSTVSRERGEVDSAAARLILQDYLDTRSDPGPGQSGSIQQESR